MPRRDGNQRRIRPSKGERRRRARRYNAERKRKPSAVVGPKVLLLAAVAARVAIDR
jgi:hypothetical protein